MKASYIFGIYAILCFLGVLIVSSDVSKPQTEVLPGKGGMFGPLEVKEKNAAYEFTVRNYVPLYKWSHIEVDVLDKNKNYLFGFGDGMWHERGRDSDGEWVESKSKYTMDVTIEKPGTYYFNVKSERNDGEGKPIKISVVKERGSTVPFIILCVISVILAISAHYYHDWFGHAASKNNTRHIVLIVVLVLVFFGALFYSIRGYGYMGYDGYHRGPSFFYWGGPTIYHDPSNRDGSVGGAGHRGGGIGSGK